MLNYPYYRPGGMDMPNDEELIDKVNSILQEKEPNVYIMHAKNDTHPRMVITDGRDNQSAFWRMDFISSYIRGIVDTIQTLE